MKYERAKKIAEEYLYRLTLSADDADDICSDEDVDEIVENIHAFEYFIDSIWKTKKIKEILEDPDYDIEDQYDKIREIIEGSNESSDLYSR